MAEDAEIIKKYEALKKQSESVGLSLCTLPGGVGFNDVPFSDGIVSFNTLNDVETFLHGYQLAYKLKNGR